MWTAGNGGRCRLPSSVCVMGLALAAAPAWGRQEAPPPLPTAEGTLAAFLVIEGWVRDWNVPHEPTFADPEGTAGACVTLRLAGRTIGRGGVFGESTGKVWRAAREAFVQAQQALPVEGDALRVRRLEEIAARVALDLQLAGRPTPLVVEVEEAVGLHVSPGLEGVAARVGERVEAVFPGVMLSTGIGPTEGLRVAMGRLGLAPLPLRDLARAQGVRVYRFPVRHVVRPGADEAPVFLYRGGRIVSAGEVSGPSLRRAAERIAHHLYEHAWPGHEPHGLAGDYKPITDRFEPLIAPPLQQAAAALALARYAGTPGVGSSEAIRAARFAVAILDGLTATTADEEDPLASPLASAMWVAAYEEARGIEGGAAVSHEFASRALAVVRATFTASGDGGSWSAGAPVVGRGLIAYALAVSAKRNEELRAEASAAVRAAFRETDATRLASEMPWLGWAELALVGGDEAVPAAVALEEMRRLCLRFQLSEDDVDGRSLDMVGGILFTRARNPLPTWHTLRPTAFLATMVGDARLTPGDLVREELARLRPALRFLFQLMIEPPLTHMFRDAERSAGGVRPAVWDQTASVDASSMALLCLSEVLRATGALAREAGPSPE